MQTVLLSIYLATAIVLLLLLYRSISSVLVLTKKYAVRDLNGVRFYSTNEPGTPFSFLKNIFWNERIPVETAEGQQIFRHEMYHVRNHHSADILFIEFAGAVAWINPIFHLLKKEIRVIHEFLADEYALSGSDRFAYAELLLWDAMQSKRTMVANTFFHNQLKRRIMMITQIKSPAVGHLAKIMALPLLLFIFCAFATNFRPGAALGMYADREVVVVIDAGHGGSDLGTVAKTGEEEKNLTLAIAKKIEKLADKYRVKVIMTRDGDILPGNATSISEGLTNRINIAEQHHADLFISIHVNSTEQDPGHAKGFSAFLSQKNVRYPECVRLGSALRESLKKTAAVSDVLQQTGQSVRILDATSMPALILECGYISNPGDLAFISNEKNQLNVAEDILEGIVAYVNNKTTVAEPPVPVNDTIIPKNEAKNSEPALQKVEVESEYPGGPSGWTQYLMKNVKYPEKAVKKEIQGTVLAQFIVNTDGSVTDIKILRSPDELLSKETLRIIKNSGKWIPAQQGGKAVRSYKKQPIVFKLQA